MVKLRLRRMGRKKRPIYALVAADSRSPRDGRIIEDLGRYNPIAEPAQFSLNEDRVLYWLGQGAQPTDTVRNLLSKEGVMMKQHLLRKGKSPEEIAVILADWQEKYVSTPKAKTTAKDRRVAALAAEVKTAEEQAEALAKARAEAEAKAKADAEAAKKAAAEARAQEEAEAAEAATAEQAEANEAQAAADAAQAETVAETTEEVEAEAADEAAAAEAAGETASEEEE